MEEAIIKRVMPHSTEAEQSVIGSMIMDTDAVLIASEVITSEDFYQKQYGVLFDAIVELYNEVKTVDLVMLQNHLRQKEVAPEIAGLEFLRDILDSTYVSTNVRQYAEIVREKSTLRRLIRACEDTANTCYAGKDTLDEVFAVTEKRIFDIIQQNLRGDFVPIKNVVLNVLENVEKASKNSGKVTGLPTGFIDLDFKTAGFQPSDLILIAARPSMGKTAFALNIAQYMAFRENIGVAVFSLEMSKEQLVSRLLSLESRVDSQAIRTGDLSDEDWGKLIEGAGVIGQSNLIIDDTPGINIMELRSKCRKYKLEHNLGIVIIDYLQLMSGSKRAESRQQEISEISRALKSLARELNVPVVALSQLSRAVEQRPDHHPVLSDLRESGAIEQDADVVMFIYRDDYYHDDSPKPNVAEINIAKQRNGSTGTIELAWLSQYTKFANMQK